MTRTKRVMKDCCFEYVTCRKYDLRVNTDMLAERSLHRKVVRERPVRNIRAACTVLHALKSTDTY